MIVRSVVPWYEAAAPLHAPLQGRARGPHAPNHMESLCHASCVNRIRAINATCDENSGCAVGLSIGFGASTTIMQLNHGRPNDLDHQQLFEVEMMTDQHVAAFQRGVQLGLSDTCA